MAERAFIDVEAITLFEDGEGELAHEERIRIGRAFNAAGLIAIASQYAGEGVRFSEPRSRLIRSSPEIVQRDPLLRGQ